MSDMLAALEARGDALEVFADCERQAKKYIERDGTDKLVAELRAARDAKRRIRLGTPNALILLHHIDRLEAELSNEPYRG